ncbi:MAG: RNA 2',3'-cyclic phosphodiesterase [Candidatus Binatia bacterium]
MRLFVAVPVPEDIRERLALLCAGLPSAKWVSPENMHLTLRFVGNVDGLQASDIDSALSMVRGEGFMLTLAGLGQFSEGQKVRSLWVGAESNPLLMRLRDKVEHAVVRAGLPPESRKFKPHITLARFQSNPGAKLGAYLAEYSLFRASPFAVQRFALFSSFLTRNGAIHSPEAYYSLAPPASSSF